MKKTVFLTAIYLWTFSVAFSQETTNESPKGFKYGNNYELTLGGITDQYSGALSWVHFHGLGKNKKFKLGYGIRYTGYTGKNQNYTTAPASLTDKDEKIDTLTIGSPQFNAINASINIQYSFSQKLEIGFNIDAVGFTFGSNQPGAFISSVRPVTLGIAQNAVPTSLNVLLVGDNDIGSLNSEFYARFWVTEKIGIKAGAGFLFTEYTTSNKLTFENDRFRNKSLMGMIGITFSPAR